MMNSTGEVREKNQEMQANFISSKYEGRLSAVNLVDNKSQA